jgi:uncharacterized protein (DUF1501 family)
MSWSRREFLRNTALITASSTLLRKMASARAPGDGTRRPRTLVQIHLGGGLDAILTTDPKVRRDVDSRVDLPYDERAIEQLGRNRVGPLFHALARHVPKMTMINGVVCSTVSHPTGFLQTHQMRRLFPRTSVGLTGTIGTLLRSEEHPVADVRFVPRPIGHETPMSAGRSLVINYQATDPAQGMLHELTEIARDDVRRAKILQVLEAQRKTCHERATCISVDATARLLRGLPRQSLPSPPQLAGSGASADAVYVIDMLAAVFRDVLYVLEHQLAPAVYVSTDPMFDTHYWSNKYQAMSMEQLAPVLSYFLDELDTRTTPDGVRLADQVGLLISSELGRFPFLNKYEGKDHFPEHPAILIGPGLVAGQFGETDERMAATPISFETGRPGARQRAGIPTIDDLGATVMRWFGIEDPVSLGYVGRSLDFVFG